MNKKKNVIEKIKSLFTITENTDGVIETTDETVEVNFVDVKTADGRILRADDIAVDMPVMEITEAGEVALEDGDYTLEDGTILNVVDGVIKEIAKPEAETAEDEVVMVEEVVEEEMAEEVVEETEVEFTEEETEMFESVKTMIVEFQVMKSEIESLKTENETLKARVNKFANEPSEEPTNTTVEFKTVTKEDKLRFFAKK